MNSHKIESIRKQMRGQWILLVNISHTWTLTSVAASQWPFFLFFSLKLGYVLEKWLLSEVCLHYHREPISHLQKTHSNQNLETSFMNLSVNPKVSKVAKCHKKSFSSNYQRSTAEVANLCLSVCFIWPFTEY